MLILSQLAAGPAITRVQGNFSAPLSSTSQSVSLPAAVGSGNAVIGAVLMQGSAALTQVADDAGNVYSVIDNPAGQGAFPLATFWRGAIGNAPKTVTVTFAALVSYIQLVIAEYSGVVGLDGHALRQATGLGTGTDVITSGSFATTKPGTVVWGVGFNSAGSTAATAGTGFTQRQRDTVAGDWGMVTEDRTLAAPSGSAAATFSTTQAFSAVMTAAIALANQ